MKNFLLKALFTFGLLTLPFAWGEAAFAKTQEVAPVDQPPSVYVDVPKPDFLPGPKENIGDGSKIQNYVLNTTIPRVINLTLGIFGILSFAAILIASMNLLTQYGNDDRVKKAKANLQWAILGFIFMVMSYAIISVVVSVALPKNTAANIFGVPTAYAVDVEDDANLLLPSQFEIIEQHDPSRRVSLPSGDLFSEMIPAVIANVFYVIGFLIFIALMMGGIQMIFARGDEGLVSKSRHIITWALLGVVAAALGYAIIYSIATINLDQDEKTDADNVFTETVPDSSEL